MSVNKDPYLSKVAQKKDIMLRGIIFLLYIYIILVECCTNTGRRMDRVFDKPTGFTPPVCIVKTQEKIRFFRFSGAALR